MSAFAPPTTCGGVVTSGFAPPTTRGHPSSPSWSFRLVLPPAGSCPPAPALPVARPPSLSQPLRSRSKRLVPPSFGLEASSRAACKAHLLSACSSLSLQRGPP